VILLKIEVHDGRYVEVLELAVQFQEASRLVDNRSVIVLFDEQT
jgi:hypothetical protein